MNTGFLTDTLERNASTFQSLLAGTTADERTFRPAPGKWNLLEIVCHLYDEERDDFRARVRHILQKQQDPLPPIDPTGWVSQRDYASQDFDSKLHAFLEERKNSIGWLRGLKDPPWINEYVHPKFGRWTAGYILANWLAHDYLHFRQITKNRYEYLKYLAGNVDYAGAW